MCVCCVVSARRCMPVVQPGGSTAPDRRLDRVPHVRQTSEAPAILTGPHGRGHLAPETITGAAEQACPDRGRGRHGLGCSGLRLGGHGYLDGGSTPADWGGPG